ncbi:type IV pilus modification protein PilV [Salinisphaera sp. SPP-AMP-43]|uniref:type IV pilus modification protein PilV n=1 Tax=Salinisphaera sp. SPP-AMP-43 TaxID=3121288 RepID=UPI003C6DCCCC
MTARQTGFTLLEALVALVVISIGLLGLLGLQTVALVNTQVSQSQTAANIAADDIAGRMRANPSTAAAAVYASIRANTSSTLPSISCAGPEAACTAAQMARFDAWEWQQNVSARLPDGAGSVDCRETGTVDGTTRCRVYAITVSWAGRSGPENADGATGQTNCPDSPSEGSRTRRCFRIEVQP